MHHHAPHDYRSPFCLVAQGIENEHAITRASDLVYQDDHLTGFISAHQWQNNKGHVLITPNDHHENLYTLPDELSVHIHRLTRRVALAMKTAYNCQGISTRQHNEPAGNQDVWHYHLHVFPRYMGDSLYTSDYELMPEPVRARYAKLIRPELHG